MQRFVDLRVWKLAHAFALSVYRLTEAFPAHEQFGLTSQLRRAALSIPTNIAEGSKRQSPTDYARFLNIAEGSAGECEYLLTFVRDLGLAQAEDVAALASQVASVGRMLFRLRTAVETNGRRVKPAKAAGGLV